MHMEAFNLIPPVGFMFDTTLAFAHMIFSGFLDKYPNLKLILRMLARRCRISLGVSTFVMKKFLLLCRHQGQAK